MFKSILRENSLINSRAMQVKKYNQNSDTTVVCTMPHLISCSKELTTKENNKNQKNDK